MRRKNSPFKGRQYLADTNPLSRTIHDLDAEKKSCNIGKVIEPHIKMFDTLSQVNLHILLNSSYSFCKSCFKNK